MTTKYKCTYTPFEGVACPVMGRHKFPHPSHCHAYDTRIWDINPEMTCKNCVPLKKGEKPGIKFWCSAMPNCDSYYSKGDNACKSCYNINRHAVFNPDDDRGQG